jgi:hypothetical protein
MVREPHSDPSRAKIEEEAEEYFLLATCDRKEKWRLLFLLFPPSIFLSGA